MKKITETQHLSVTDVRDLCIRKDYYTRGTNEEYIAMFDMVRELERSKIITGDMLYPIAKDIYDHSAPECFCGYEVQDVIFELAQKILRTYDVEDVEEPVNATVNIILLRPDDCEPELITFHDCTVWEHRLSITLHSILDRPAPHVYDDWIEDILIPRLDELKSRHPSWFSSYSLGASYMYIPY